MACTLAVADGTVSTNEAAAAGTALPAGWELCVLQGVQAPVTQANVVDLDAWQQAEGGSTNNTAAYNPFNTARTTDVSNTPLPVTNVQNGFPAFSDWFAGCAATVATLLQPNMWSIDAALRAGNVAPPAAFLAAVDQSQWCAPSADGTPCYESSILGPAGSVAVGLLADSAALQVYGNVKSDVHDYQVAVAAATADQTTLTTRNQQLAAAEVQVSLAQNKAVSAGRQLRTVVIDEYVSNGLYSAGPYLGGNPSNSAEAKGVMVQQYERIITNDLLSQFQLDRAAVKAAQSHKNDAAKAVEQATATLALDHSAVERTLVKLVADVGTMQKAGACTTVPTLVSTPIAATSPPPAGGASTGSGATTTTTSPPVATTTTPAAVATITVPSTTTTTAPTSVSTTTTTAAPTPTTAPPTKSPSPSSTTTTTTVPSGSSATTGPAPQAPPSANPVGLVQLQGCVSSLAPQSA
jgi:hypothetical protein